MYTTIIHITLLYLTHILPGSAGLSTMLLVNPIKLMLYTFRILYNIVVVYFAITDQRVPLSIFQHTLL